MRFTSDRQRRAVFANMMNGPVSGSNMVKFSNEPPFSKVAAIVGSKAKENQFSEKANEEFKEGLNGFICPVCGDVVAEDDISSHSCKDSGVNSTEELVESGSSGSSTGTIVEEHIIDEDYDDEYDYEDEEEDSLFG